MRLVHKLKHGWAEKNWNYLAEIGLDFTFHSELNTEVEVLLNQVKHSKLNDHNQLKSTDTTLVTSLKSEPNAWNHQWQELFMTYD